MTIISAPANSVLLDTGMHYRIRNNTDHRLTDGTGRTPLLRYNRIAYDVGPGQEIIVPWAVICLYFGDPRSKVGTISNATDSQGDHQIPSREEEILRMSVFYGVYEQGADGLAAFVPDVSIFTLDGVEIIPPCFDPDGENAYGFTPTSLEKSGDVKTLIDDMQRQIDALKARDAKLVDNGDNDGALLVDTPQRP